MKRLGIVAALVLAGCGQSADVEYGKTVRYVVQPVTIVAVDPPKRFDVDIRLPSGKIMHGVAHRKRCARWRETAQIDAVYEVPFRVSRSITGKEYFFLDETALREILCG